MTSCDSCDFKIPDGIWKQAVNLPGPRAINDFLARTYENIISYIAVDIEDRKDDTDGYLVDEEQGIDVCLACDHPIATLTDYDIPASAFDIIWCDCPIPASMQLVEEIASMSYNDGILYAHSISTNALDCEDCDFAYTTDCPFLSDRTQEVTKALGSKDINEITGKEYGPFVDSIEGEPLEPCDQYSYSDWDDSDIVVIEMGNPDVVLEMDPVTEEPDIVVESSFKKGET